jgi:isopenicillin N synthase-like dioxygenase
MRPTAASDPTSGVRAQKCTHTPELWPFLSTWRRDPGSFPARVGAFTD